MSKKAHTILTLNHEEAMDFFMKSEQYHGFELPEYFTFDEVLKYVRGTVGEAAYEDCLNEGVSPDNLSDVNLDILLNKDGRYAVRPIMLANPFLYYFLVREVCNEENWTQVKTLFDKFKVPHITSCAIPVIPKEKEAFHKATTINNWWNSMEQRSIELSLEYRYMFVTDITNCHGSVNPQTFDWAFSLKGTSLETNSESEIAKDIQKYLRAFQQGRNIGIPQGSAIFDFVGEIILGYSDLLLHEELQKKVKECEEQGKTFPPYEIIRYRDDYRIFCSNKEPLEDISYILQQVLERLNFRMNSQKTKISDSIVTDAVKTDKLAYIYNTPIFNKKGVDFDSFEKHLLYILMFSRNYRDSGSVKTMLSDIDKRIKDFLEPNELELDGRAEPLADVIRSLGSDVLNEAKLSASTEDELRSIEQAMSILELENEGEASSAKDSVFSKPKVYDKRKMRHLPGGSVRAMSAICVQIALENVNCSHYALRVLSRMVESLDDEAEKWDIRDKVYEKLCNQPNSDYSQLWLQNITYQRDQKNGTSPYTMRLCRVAAGDKGVELWNNSWLKPSLQKGFESSAVIEEEVLQDTTPVITFRETRAYYDSLEYCD